MLLEATKKGRATVTGVQETKDYKKFKNLKGNRALDNQHVHELITSFTRHGNLTNEFPIVVNEHMEIIDGQHRVAALKQLGWPVGYRVQEGLTIDTVRHINIAQKNWNWLDYANSYASLGNENYKRVLEIHEQFGYGFNVLALYGGFTGLKSKVASGQYVSGELIFTPEQKEKTIKLLTMLKECEELLEPPRDRVFKRAMYTIFQSPEYDHERMLHKFGQYGDRLKSYSLVNDYLRAIEDVYNFNAKEGYVRRLF